MPRMMFLPGASGGADFWQPASALVLPDRPRHLFSWPGLGNQPHDERVRGIEDLVDLVLERLDELAAEGPCDLIAQSMGGLIAVKVALRVPGRIRRLVLTAASAGIPLSDHGGAEWYADYRRAFPAAAPWVGSVGEDLTARIPEITLPTLLIWGDADPVSPVAVGRRMAELLPKADLKIVSGGTHGLAITHAAEVAALISAFLT